MKICSLWKQISVFKLPLCVESLEQSLSLKNQVASVWNSCNSVWSLLEILEVQPMTFPPPWVSQCYDQQYFSHTHNGIPTLLPFSVWMSSGDVWWDNHLLIDILPQSPINLICVAIWRNCLVTRPIPGTIALLNWQFTENSKMLRKSNRINGQIQVQRGCFQIMWQINNSHSLLCSKGTGDISYQCFTMVPLIFLWNTFQHSCQTNKHNRLPLNN